MSNGQQPSRPSGNGRAGGGRFAAGNTVARGNPHAQRVQEIRSALLEAVTLDDVKAIGAKLVTMAKAGDIAAAKLVLDRVLGRVPVDVVSHVLREERCIQQEQQRAGLEDDEDDEFDKWLGGQ